MAAQTVLGFDFGSKSIGVAVGQAVTGQANPLPALKARNGIPNWDEIAELVKEWQPDAFVVGLPLNMDGTNQHVTFAAKKFANRLFSRYGKPSHMQDERLTTADAKAEIFSRHGYKGLNKDKVDGISACLIVESWYESQYQ
ncbi:Holliday junction resolvase RuvX [Motilimonas pumila]|uniref:Putative pre-16S rRNA nuclease n=1 Tax=Motilimonas pumila TaxID=2303987 RepID=A0A418YAN6_9GAMM|nr:Holliday junction resolvase RuvX [Motilimonas pumila]RJG40016.1 Holliday junction resolvase RuvX [Motilimonas pumila]